MQGFALSPQQKRLWRLQRSVAVSPYGVRSAVETAAEGGAVRRALAATVHRHEILRTTFRCLPGMDLPLQVIAEEGTVLFYERDLTALGSAAQQAQIEGLPRPVWSLEAGPLLRASLLTLSPGRRMLVLEAPALCMDVLGMERLLLDLGRELGGDSTAEDEGVQYADLAAWLNEALESEETRAGREFWRQQDLGSLAAGWLPFARRSADGFRPRAASVPLPALAAARLAAVAAACGVSVEAWLLACWQALLARWTGLSRLVIGFASDGRSYAELQGSPGPFARVLPLSCGPDEDRELDELARAAADTVETLTRWQNYFSWEDLAENGLAAPQAAPGAAYAPFGFELWPAPEALPGGPLSAVALRDACIDRFLVKLRADLRGGGLGLSLCYDAACLDAADAGRLAASLAALIADAVERPRATVGDLEVDGGAARRQAVGAGRAAAPEAGDAVHRRFARLAAERPADFALRAEEVCWTYADLDARANRLAHHLRRLGVGPESRVALLLDRSAETVAALLGVLKAGGAYVPLDPQLPAGRLASMLEDSGAAVVVTRGRLADALPSHGVRAVRLDVEEEAIAALPAVAPEDAAGPGNLAYVMYTSGSTGRPKGVAVEHRHLLAYVDGLAARLGSTPGVSQATVSTFAADLGHTTVFAALCGGGCLHVVAQERTTDPEAFGEYFERHAVGILKIVPSHLQALLNARRPERALPRLRLVLGGERLGWDLVRRVRELAPKCEIVNHYGPTETTVGATTFRLGPETADGLPVPLGHALPHSEVLVLNRRMRLCPAGVEGEIYIGGEGVARGYFGRPAQTAERFLPDPFASRPGMRLYRTGDLGCRRPDGAVEFRGRADRQVKIRGFRVELEEIERALERQSGVRQAVTAVWESAPGEQRLAAYVVPDREAGLTRAGLRQLLRDQLPDYMIPAAVVFLEALPLTPNGKVDHRALPDPEVAVHEEGARTEPRTPVEELLAGLWTELLRVERVAAGDNFFDLGGHSLLAMQLNSRIGRMLGLELPLGAVFEARSLADLARRVEAALLADRGLAAPPLRAASSAGGDSPLSFAQERHWVLQQLDPESPLYNIRGLLRAAGTLRLDVLEAALREVLCRHEVLRASFPVTGDGPVQRVGPVPPVAIPLVDLRAIPGAERESAGAAWANQIGLLPFALDRAPVLRLAALRLDDRDHLLVLVLHHIVADRWTIRILLRDLAVLYSAFAEGRPSPLPPLGLQYADFARWQREWMQGEVLDRQLAYWREALAGAPPVLDLSIARPRPARPTGRSARVPVELPAGLGTRLEELSRRQGCTLFQTWLLAFQVLLRWYSGQDDIVVGAPVANRTRLETEGLIGCFINALALRTRFEGNPAFAELLARVRESLLRAYTHQDVPFERLLQEIQPERVAGAAPIFQAVLNFANDAHDPIELPGLRITPWAHDLAMEAKVDLILTVIGAGDGMRAFFIFSLDLFEAPAVQRMAAGFVRLLERVAESPGAPLLDLDRTLADEDRRSRIASGREARSQRQRTLANVRRQSVQGVVMETSK